MLDPILLRKEIDSVTSRLQTRGFNLDVDTYNGLESRRKALQSDVEQKQGERNRVSKEIGKLKSKGEDASAQLSRMSSLSDALKEDEGFLVQLQGELNALVHGIPNLPHESTPVGADENDKAEGTVIEPSSFW